MPNRTRKLSPDGGMFIASGQMCKVYKHNLPGYKPWVAVSPTGVKSYSDTMFGARFALRQNIIRTNQGGSKRVDMKVKPESIEFGDVQNDSQVTFNCGCILSCSVDLNEYEAPKVEDRQLVLSCPLQHSIEELAKADKWIITQYQCPKF